MKRILTVVLLAIATVASTMALTYEEAYDSIKSMPNMQGVRQNSYPKISSLGISNAKIALKFEGFEPVMPVPDSIKVEPVVYSDALHGIIASLPSSELVKGYLDEQRIFVVYSHPITSVNNKIFIIFDNAFDGNSGVILGEITDQALEQFTQSLLVRNDNGGINLYFPVSSIN